MLHHGLELAFGPGVVDRTRADSTRPSARVSWAAMASRMRTEINGERPVVSEKHPLASAVALRKLELRPDRGLRRYRARSRRRRGRPLAGRPGSSSAATSTAAPTSSVQVAATIFSPRSGLIRHHAADDAGRADRDDRVDGRVPHIRALSGCDEALGEASQRLLAASVDRLGARQARQAEHDQHKHHRRSAGEDARVAGYAVDVAPDDEEAERASDGRAQAARA